MKTRTNLAIAACLFLWLSPAAADVIYLIDGSKQMGIITLDRSDLPTISIRTSSGTIAIPRNKIKNVDKEKKALSLARVGDQYLDRERFEEAANEYRAALEEDKNDETIAAKLRQAEGGVARSQKAADAANLVKIDDVITKAKQLANEKKFEPAVQMLRGADPGDQSPKTDEYKRAYAEVYVKWGADMADRQDFAGAAEKLQLSLKLDPTNDDARAQLAKVWERDPSKLKEVAAFYKDSSAPEDQLKLAETLFKMKNYEQALPIYLRFVNEPKLGTDVMRDRIRLMFDMLHRQYAEKGEFQKAYDTYSQFLDYSPNEDPVPLAKYEYMMRRAKTDASDVNARVELARFAEEKGMYPTAKQEYLAILQMAPENGAAAEGLRRFASADLQDANDFFAEGQFLLASQKAGDTIREYTMFADIVKQAQQVQTKAAVEQQKIARNQQQQAVALAARGDDYYNQALSYISAYTSTNLKDTTRVFSPKVEATKYLQRALYSWQTALQIDPSLGNPTSYDLYRKISDAYARYVVLANPLPPRLPSRDLDRMNRGHNVPGAL